MKYFSEYRYDCNPYAIVLKADIILQEVLNKLTILLPYIIIVCYYLHVVQKNNKSVKNDKAKIAKVQFFVGSVK